jgi:hypothetical protein
MHLKPTRMTNTHASLEVMPSNYIQRHMDVDYVKFQFGDEVEVFSSADDPITMHCLLLPRWRQQHVFLYDQRRLARTEIQWFNT